VKRTTRYSKKRESILNVIRSTDCHPSAEWVYQQLKPTHPDLSLGTVYRNLTFFQENGDIQSVGVVKGQERFDGVATPHSHFVCNCCGCVLDLPQINLDAHIDEVVRAQYGLAVRHHELTFYGLCPTCMQKNQSEEETPA
jgi:Fur family peroxide stress response transcriptional regulator